MIGRTNLTEKMRLQCQIKISLETQLCLDTNNQLFTSIFYLLNPLSLKPDGVNLKRFKDVFI